MMTSNKPALSSSIMSHFGDRSGLSDLWRRLRFLLLAFIVYRIGAHIPVPGVNPEKLLLLFEQNKGTILSLFNVFSGGALERMSIMALGIMPYISASIIMQLMTVVTPQLDQIRKEGESGRKKINQYTRYGTVLIALLQGFGVAAGLASQGIAFESDFSYYLTTVVSFVCGSVFLMWLGEQITERGIGNGISMIIFAGIVAGLPSAFGQTIESTRQGDLHLLVLLLVSLFAIAVIAFIVFVEKGQRRIPITYARHRQGNMVSPQNSHLPLKVNMAGVIPPIFASAILLLPASMGQWFGSVDSMGWLKEISYLLAPSQPLYLLLFAAGIIFFCYFYTALVYNPKEVADNLKKSGACISGLRPGERTAAYIDKVLTRLTLFGALYITLVSLLPQLLMIASGVPFYFGGTSLLIVVVVLMDFISQVQMHLMGRQYESLLKKSGLKYKTR